MPFWHSQGEPSVPKFIFVLSCQFSLCNWNAEQKACCFGCSIRWQKHFVIWKMLDYEKSNEVKAHSSSSVAIVWPYVSNCYGGVMSNTFQSYISSVKPIFFLVSHHPCCQWGVHSLWELANLSQIVSISWSTGNWVSQGSSVFEENVILVAL